ncbi:MAG: hypothetical protein NTY20_03455 [Candidatus Aenigmarchaeota archaeon]|nr:hypothetical protein [Candidatus Aenigmarchaeota archaeon]
MAYDPRTIIKLNFGKYAREENGKLKEHLPSMAQIPLIDYRGFSYLDGYLSKPEKTDRIVIEPHDLEYVQANARAFREFPVRIKCEGAHGACEKKDIARHLVLSYDRTYNHPKKVEKGGPERINQIHAEQSYFCCEYCAGVRETDKRSERDIEESGILKLKISFKLPDFFTEFPEKLNWNIDRAELHGKFRKIAYQLTKHKIGDTIDSVLAAKERVILTEYAAQEIANKLLGIRESDLPCKNEDYSIRKLKWHLSDVNQRGQYSFNF